MGTSAAANAAGQFSSTRGARTRPSRDGRVSPRAARPCHGARGAARWSGAIGRFLLARHDGSPVGTPLSWASSASVLASAADDRARGDARRSPRRSSAAMLAVALPRSGGRVRDRRRRRARRLARRALPLAGAGDQLRRLGDARRSIAAALFAGARARRRRRRVPVRAAPARGGCRWSLNFVDRRAARSRCATARPCAAPRRAAATAPALGDQHRADRRRSPSSTPSRAWRRSRSPLVVDPRVLLHGAAGRRMRATAARQYANAVLGRAQRPDAHARRARPARRAPRRRGRALLPRHRRAARHDRARPGARAHRRPAARHRPLRAVRPRHGARHAR